MNKHERRRLQRAKESEAFTNLVKVLTRRQRENFRTDTDMADIIGISRVNWVRWRKKEIGWIPLKKTIDISKRLNIHLPTVLGEKDIQKKEFESFEQVQIDYNKAIRKANYREAEYYMRKLSYITYEMFLINEIPATLFNTSALKDGLITIDCQINNQNYRFQVNGFNQIIYAFGEFGNRKPKRIFHEGALYEPAVTVTCDFLRSKLSLAEEEQDTHEQFLRNAREASKSLT